MQRTQILLRWSAVILLVVGARPAFADDPKAVPEPEPAELAMTTKRVVIFKDGYALFVREGKATADDQGRVHTYEVPKAAVLGSFWAFSQASELVGMEAEAVRTDSETTSEGDCRSIAELLLANRGRTVTLHLQGDTELTGKIAGVLGGIYVSIEESSRGAVVLPIKNVHSLSAPALTTQMERTKKQSQTRRRLRLNLGKAQAGKATTVTMMYFAPGVRWIPTYRVSGDLVSKANLALQAEILNENMDLTDVAADLVVGVPHFKFRDVISPLTLEAQLRNALLQAAPQLMSQRVSLSNAYFANRSGEVRTPRPVSGIDVAPELAKAGAQDLFVYSLPSLTLAKGARATVPLWQSEVPLKHIYTLDIQVGRDVRGGRGYVWNKQGRMQAQSRSGRTESPLDLAKHEVWHQLELTNDSNVPWTTGAALSMKGLLPLGQDMLTYTSLGALARLPLTLAVDVCADYEEEETARVQNGVKWHGNQYARITKRATIQVCNYRNKKTSLRVSFAFGGKALSASAGGTIKIDDYHATDWTRRGYESHLNNHSDVAWDLELAPGEVKEITVDYELFVR